MYPLEDLIIVPGRKYTSAGQMGKIYFSLGTVRIKKPQPVIR